MICDICGKGRVETTSVKEVLHYKGRKTYIDVPHSYCSYCDTTVTLSKNIRKKQRLIAKAKERMDNEEGARKD